VSHNGNAFLVFQTDGNLVVYKVLRDGSTKVAWATGTGGGIAAAGEALMQPTDGNFGVYDVKGEGEWCSGTNNVGHTVVMQGDCNLVIYNEFDKAVWDTGTSPC
jgi:hypothetical protein